MSAASFGECPGDTEEEEEEGEEEEERAVAAVRADFMDSVIFSAAALFVACRSSESCLGVKVKRRYCVDVVYMISSMLGSGGGGGGGVCRARGGGGGRPGETQETQERVTAVAKSAVYKSWFLAYPSFFLLQKSLRPT